MIIGNRLLDEYGIDTEGIDLIEEMETVRADEALTGCVPTADTLRCASTQQLMRDFARLADWQNAVFAEFGRAARDRGDYRNADKVKGMLGSEIKSRL